MSRIEAVEQYTWALKKGRRSYRSCVLRGRYPYPQVLDEILGDTMTAGQTELGLVEIPLDQVAGTKTEGRRSAFSADFMPLLEPDTEFAFKWIELCEAHLGDEGIRDPIRCYEYMGRFYVQEGNKRVSVLKSYQAATIPAYVTRMVPAWSEDPAILAYYEFMQTYQKTGLYRVRFSRAGSFAKLQTALGFEADHTWTEEEQRRFIAGYTAFAAPFCKLGGDELPITPADALLVWLKVYPFGDLWKLPEAQLQKTVRAIWPDIRGLAEENPITVADESQEDPEKGFLGRIFRAKPLSHLNVAFISDYLPEESDWARAHDLGRQYLETVLEDQVTVQHYEGTGSGSRAEDAIEEAIQQGAQVIFATTPPLIGACRKAAARHPHLRIFNCSVSMPYSGVRTYYGRIYEAEFIAGAVAGVMSRDGQIGYVATSPIFGVPAGINAFALGAQLTNPHVRVRLRWSCLEERALEVLAQEGISIISNRDLPAPDRSREAWGLCRMQDDGSFRALISPYWHWGSVYLRLVRMLMAAGGDVPDSGRGKAVNYWWGMSSRAIDILMGEDLPAGVRQLAELLRQGIIEGSILPFGRPIRDQQGTVRSDGSCPLSLEEILHMDWLCDCVDGAIPGYDQLLPMARPIVRLQGVYRDQIPPEKEGPIL